MSEKGTISVHTENIFPIIKKFLYLDQDIFLRELVTNGIDAIQKLKHLSSTGSYGGPVDHPKIEITISTSDATIRIKDNGLGMTEDDIKQYINQIAFSGATAFIEQHKEQMDQKQLLGFFGLGFYSAFMVADQVEIISKSYQADSRAVHWICDGSTNFEISEADKKDVGTEVILHVAEDAKEFLDHKRLESILMKHCRFLPVDIFLNGQLINKTKPLWIQNPQELSKEDYLAFYKALYPSAQEPLFWIHLNIEYPFTLTGILYFPKLVNYFEQQETIQLYAKLVFITQNVKDVIPDFLRLLHGIIDSPDIPLNVSRNALQADSNVKKISRYISKKVAEKLEEYFVQDRDRYKKTWNDIELFVKYGLITDTTFYDKTHSFALLESIDGSYYTISEYQTKIQDQQTDKHGNCVILYTQHPQQHAIYIKNAKQVGYDVIHFRSPIDTNFINFIEDKFPKIKLKSIDTDAIGNLIEKEQEIKSNFTPEQENSLKADYEKTINLPHITWHTANMLPEELPVKCTSSELMNRLEQFTQRGSLKQDGQKALQLAINVNHRLIECIVNAQDNTLKEELIRSTYYLALLAQGLLHGQELTDFIEAYVNKLEKSS